MDLTASPYLMLAAATIGKQITSRACSLAASKSLANITQALASQQHGSAEVQRLQEELQIKAKVLLMPVDACVKRLRSNTLLRGAVEVALEALRQISAFEEEASAQQLSAARSDGAAVMTPQVACTKLQKLIDQLDGLVPYLNVAISSAVLAAHDGSSGAGGPSLSHLLFASAALQAVHAGEADACVFEISKAQLYKEVVTRTQHSMQAMFPLCSLRLLAGVHASSAASSTAAVPLYSLHIQQSLADGLYHEDEEEAEEERLLVRDITALACTTANSLGLEMDPFSPVLSLEVLRAPSTHQSAITPGAPATPAAASETVAASQKPQVLAILSAAPPEGENADTDEASAVAAQQALDRLSYTIRLCKLEAEENLCHIDIEDDRLQAAFAEHQDPGFDAGNGNMQTPGLQSQRSGSPDV